MRTEIFTYMLARIGGDQELPTVYGLDYQAAYGREAKAVQGEGRQQRFSLLHIRPLFSELSNFSYHARYERGTGADIVVPTYPDRYLGTVCMR